MDAVSNQDRKESFMPSIIRPKSNRRQWPRHEKSYLVQVSTSLKSGFIPAKVSNFSRGGLSLFFSEALPKDASVMVRLPQDLVGLAKDVKARVKWCVPSDTGGFAIGVQYEEPLRWTRYE